MAWSAGFNHKDGAGPGDDGAQRHQRLDREFVEHMTDDEQSDRLVRRQETRGGLRHTQGGEGGLRRPHRAVAREGRGVPDNE